MAASSIKAPKVVLDISGVQELGGIDESDGGITIGPLATHTELMRSDLLREFAPLLGSAAAAIGSPQIRDRGTVGGNIMNAAACADTVPPLIALDATVTLRSKGDCREMALAELFVKPYQTKAKPDELLAAIRFPKLAPRSRSAFIKLGRRNALSHFPIERRGHTPDRRGRQNHRGAHRSRRGVPDWKTGAGSRADARRREAGAEAVRCRWTKVSEEMIKATDRRWSTEYKEPVVAVLVRRALEECVEGRARLSPARRAGAIKPMTRGPLHPWRRARDSAPCHRGVHPTTVNGRLHTLTIPANRTLLDLLRDHLGLPGTKCGCEIGECGACTVLLDGEPVNACLVLAPQINGRQVLTVEGVAQNGKLHPLQESFLDHDAVHCGFCTPGMLLSAKALLDWNPAHTETEIRTAISGNLCRCTGYQQIVEAIEQAAAHRQSAAKPRKLDPGVGEA